MQAEIKAAQQAVAEARRLYKDANALAKSKTVSRNEVKALSFELKDKRGRLNHLIALKKHQEHKIALHQLQAPFDGVVSKRYIERGEWLSPGQQTIELVAINELEIELNLPQSAYSRINTDAQLQLALESQVPDYFTTSIVRLVPIVDPNSRSFIVRTKLSNAKHSLIPGMSVSGFLKVPQAKESLIIERNAIQRLPDGRVMVWLVEDNNGVYQVKQQQVSLGLSFDGKLEVLKGLSLGDRIVIAGNELLHDGQKVTIKQQLQSQSKAKFNHKE